MVPVPGFPRELRPPPDPDALPDASDVEAYKRTVWRAGRWPGPASSFDRAYNKQFAHGRAGGNVADSGVAGVQRQQRMEPNGVVDKVLFNALRSIRIPAGLPNAGQPAMDALAQNLVAEAWQRFNQPPPQPTRVRALDGAANWIGYSEQPAGSNQTVFGKWYSVDAQPWCAIFVSYCYEVEAGGSPSFQAGRSYAYVPYIVADAYAGANGLTVASNPIEGDLVCYDWHWDGLFDHVGLFEAWTGLSTFTAVEGNTSTSNEIGRAHV